MFDFSVLIAIEIAILVFYFASYIQLKKELDDLLNLSTNSSENYLKINNRKNKLKFLNIVAIFLVLFILILYFLPNIITGIKKIDIPDFHPISFSDVGNFLLKFVPFKEGFFLIQILVFPT